GQPINYLASIYCNYGITNYSDRFGLFREDISGCNPNLSNIANTSHWYIMKQNPCRTGAQMLWSVQDGPLRMNRCGILPNTKSMVLDSAVNKGLALSMRYLEIYGSDISDATLTSSIQQANNKLIVKGISCGSSVVPVKLIYFNGSCQNNSVVLNWATASEINNAYFNIERSLDGVSWKLVGKKMSATNGSSTNNYTFIDDTIQEDNYYYRLRQVDVDGKSVFSNIIYVGKCEKSSSKSISVFPNPANQYLTFASLNNQSNIGEISIINALGMQIKKVFVTQNKTISITDLPNGVYLIKFKDFPHQTTKFIKL
ncbi:MAG: T9SS type A sorting domain-containing protein, partial [Ferruginibacter sp.]